MKDPDDLPFTRKLAFSAAAAGIVLLLLGATAAIGETVMRVLAPKSDALKLGVRLPESARGYGLLPNTRSVQQGVVVQTNALGFRDKDYPLERTAGVRRIVVLGDSYTFGVGVEFAETYGKRLEAALNRAWGPTEVITFGVSGYNTRAELATFRETAAQFRPDLVIIGYVLNDIELLTAAGGAERDARGVVNDLHVTLKSNSMLYTYLSPKLGALAGLFNARYAVGSTNQVIRSYDDDSAGWSDSRRALLELVAEAQAIGAPVLVAVFPMMIDFSTYPLRPAHDKVTRFCRDHRIDVLDLLPRFEGADASELTVFLDGHPNSRAHAIFADEILRHVTRSYAL